MKVIIRSNYKSTESVKYTPVRIWVFHKLSLFFKNIFPYKLNLVKNSIYLRSYLLQEELLEFSYTKTRFNC